MHKYIRSSESLQEPAPTFDEKSENKKQVEVESKKAADEREAQAQDFAIMPLRFASLLSPNKKPTMVTIPSPLLILSYDVLKMIFTMCLPLNNSRPVFSIKPNSDRATYIDTLMRSIVKTLMNRSTPPPNAIIARWVTKRVEAPQPSLLSVGMQKIGYFWDRGKNFQSDRIQLLIKLDVLIKELPDIPTFTRYMKLEDSRENPSDQNLKTNPWEGFVKKHWYPILLQLNQICSLSCETYSTIHLPQSTFYQELNNLLSAQVPYSGPPVERLLSDITIHRLLIQLIPDKTVTEKFTQMLDCLEIAIKSLSDSIVDHLKNQFKDNFTCTIF